jgi:hypothetical protein
MEQWGNRWYNKVNKNQRTILIAGRGEESYREHLELLKALEGNDAEENE